jgi:AraC-like DNA-binding protein
MQQLLYRILELDRSQGGHPAGPPPIDVACETLGDDLQGRLDLKGLAQELGLSYVHFRRRFREVTGTSPGQYRLRRRMETARTILEGGETTLSQTAGLLGYADVFTFSRQFKKTLGLPPSHV